MSADRGDRFKEGTEPRDWTILQTVEGVASRVVFVFYFSYYRTAVRAIAGRLKHLFDCSITIVRVKFVTLSLVEVALMRLQLSIK